MSNITKIIGGIIIIIIVVILVWYGASKKAEEEIKIGAILFLTGDYAVIGQEMQKGIDIAVDEINSGGGINGRELKMIYEDGGVVDLQKITTAAHKLINVDKVDAVLIDSLSTIKPVASLFQQNKVPAILIFDSAEFIENAGDYIFAIGFSTEKTGEKMAEFVYSNHNLEKVAIIAHIDEIPQTLSQAFKNKLEKLGGEVILFENVNVEERDFRTVIAKIRNSESEGVYLVLIQNVDLFLRQAKEQGLNLSIFGNDAFTEDAISAAGSAAEDAYFANFYVEDNQILESLIEKYKEKYNEEPQLLIFNALAYDGILVLREAMKKIETVSPQYIKEALYEVKNLPTSSGEEISISTTGVVGRSEKIYQVKNGKGVAAE